MKENIDTCDRLSIKTRPVFQITQDDKIIKMWSGPSQAMRTLGYGRNQIESVLYGKRKTAQGFKWRWLMLEELGTVIQ